MTENDLKTYKVIREFISPPRLGDKRDKVEGIFATSPEGAIIQAFEKLNRKPGTYSIVR